MKKLLLTTAGTTIKKKKIDTLKNNWMDMNKAPSGIFNEAVKLCIDNNGIIILDGARQVQEHNLLRILLKDPKIGLSNANLKKVELLSKYLEDINNLFQMTSKQQFDLYIHNLEGGSNEIVGTVGEDADLVAVVEAEVPNNLTKTTKLIPSPITFKVEECFSKDFSKSIRQASIENEKIINNLYDFMHRISILALNDDFPADVQYEDAFLESDVESKIAVVIPIVFEQDSFWIDSHGHLLGNSDSNAPKRVNDNGSSELAIKKLLKNSSGQLFIILANEKQYNCNQAAYLRGLCQIYYKRMQIVYHSDFIPKQCLPTINSLVIERYM